MKLKNIKTPSKLTEAPLGAVATPARPVLRNTLANGPTKRTAFAANDNIVKQAGNMAGMSGATAEEIVSSPWYTRWYNTFASGAEYVGSGFKVAGKVVSKIALPLVVVTAIYDGWVEISEISKDDPNRRKKIITIVTKLVADYGFPDVAGYLGAMAGGSVGAWVGGIGAAPGAFIGGLTATAAAFIAQYKYGDDIDQAIEDFVDNVIMDAKPAATNTVSTSLSDRRTGIFSGPVPPTDEHAQQIADAAALDFVTPRDATGTYTKSYDPVTKPTTRDATGTYTSPYDPVTKPTTRDATGTYTSPYDPVTKTAPVTKPVVSPKVATALTPAQQLAAKPSTPSVSKTASSPSGTTPNGVKPLPVVTVTPTTYKSPNKDPNVVNTPKTPIAPTATTKPSTLQPNYDDLTFKQAFARARERASELSPNDAGKYTFTWHGKPYQTNYKGTGTTRNPNEPYITQNKQRGMLSTAPIKNPYENPKRKSSNPIGEGRLSVLADAGKYALEKGKWLGDSLGSLLKGSKAADAAADAATVGTKLGTTLERSINGKTYKYFEDLNDPSKSFWYDAQAVDAGAKKQAYRITQQNDPDLFAELSKTRSAEADVAKITAATPKVEPPAKTGLAGGGKPVPAISAAAKKLLTDTPVERWTAEQLASRGYDAADVPILAALQAKKVDIVNVEEEIIKNAPWYKFWYKTAKPNTLPGKILTKNNLIVVAIYSIKPVVQAIIKQSALDKNDPNYERRRWEIWTECVAEIGIEATAGIVGGIIGGKLMGTITSSTRLQAVAAVLGDMAAGTAASVYISPNIESVVGAVSDSLLGNIPRGAAASGGSSGDTPGGPGGNGGDTTSTTNSTTNANPAAPINTPQYGNVNNNPLYKKAYNWAIKSGFDAIGAGRFANQVMTQGPSGSWAQQLNATNESIALAWLYKQLNESHNARRTVNIHSKIKLLLSESNNPVVSEKVAFELLDSGILDEMDTSSNNFMANITAAIAANTSGDKTGAQTALDAAKLNNPASGMDQTTQKNMLDQLAKANPSLKIPAINPNSTQTINPNAPPTSSADPNPGNQNSTQSQPDNMEEDDPMGAGNDWQTSMIADDPTSKGMDFTAAYNEFAAKYPAAKFLLDIVPITGTATSMIDGSQDLYNGKYGQAAIDLLGALPAFKLGKYLSKGLQTAVKSINKGARAVNVGNAAASYIGNTSSSATAGTVPTTNAAGDNISESPRLGDHVMLELADGRTVSAPIVELRGNSMVVELDDTGRKWLNESPEHTALKIGNDGHALSSTAQFWNNMIQHLTHDTPAGWAHIFVNLQNATGHAARTLPEQWAKIWRQQHIALGDQLTRGDMMNWIKEVQAAIDRSGVAESAHTPAGGDKLRKQLNKKDPAMLAVWMASRAGARGMSVAKFAKSKATASGVDANHWWDKIKHLVSESSYRKGFNFDETDIAAITVMTDVKKARERAIQLMSGRSTRPMNSDKIRWFTQHVNTLATPMAVAKMMYDMLLSGEGLAVIGTKGGMSSNSYRKTFKEDDEEVSDDDEEELMYDAIDHMESLYHALKNKGFLEAANRLSALGSLYQEDGVYLPTAIDMITDRQVKIHIRDIPRLLEDNKHEVIRGILKMITMYSTTSSNDINNLITVLDVFNADWPELDALSDAVNKSLPGAIKESSRAITSEGTNFKIYVKDPSTNNIQMVRFGDTAGLSIKRNVSESAKTYKDMHTCKTSSAKQVAEWTCKMWTAKPAKLKGLK